jgi:tRNA dimethylallyltransferase
MAIAERWPVEIISVDSALVYRGMDIGSAKPSAAERAQVPHHLIDILDPLQSYSAADFVRDTTRLVAEIQGRGRTALLVGGTMLYFKALLVGLDDMPQADAAVRERIEARAREAGWPALHAELARVDPATAARLPPNDAQRIQRALEVFEVSGKPISSFQTGRSHNPDSPLAPEHLISLEPHDRAWLHARIAQRFDDMLAAGFIDEVRKLRARGDLCTDLSSMRCVGYRQAWDMLDAHGDALTPAHMAELRDLGIFATRQLGKRQLTWLRSMPQRRVIACDAPDALPQVLRAVEQLLGAPA